MPDLLPVFLNLSGRPVLLVGGGPVAAAKLQQLLAAGATSNHIRVVAPSVDPSIEGTGVAIEWRGFEPGDLDGTWFAVAAATADVNRRVAAAAEARRVFVNAVDDPANASAFLGGVVRRGGVTVAISTNGEAPALAGLLREALDALLPRELGRWLEESRRQRPRWRRHRVPMQARRPLLLHALNDLYRLHRRPSSHEGPGVVRQFRPAGATPDRGPLARIPWLSAPEDSWL
jgi:uroporphyrin-III C-methyltransferase / precorrin-2 dehydrogenase / sirohydrochlorin ferrochelatase